ncbi:hypothetical protein PIB30_076618 [Stylosanthes scabra]|uniref:Uncharacterized protein n=1 Tax=Stylosanthes scabra TaxID=79078 RepID=A0ABU6UP32_9FABA|nr:hypothetical protein [Stylosanthes scabra]
MDTDDDNRDGGSVTDDNGDTQAARTVTHVSNTFSLRAEEANKYNNPLFKEIMAYQILTNFTLPTTLKAYDGIRDPNIHVTKFQNMMLLNGSIFSFDELADLFNNHFAASAVYVCDFDYLSTINQGQHES